MATTLDESKATDTVREYILGEQITCTLDDGRTVTGTLVCIDRLRNMILRGVVEERTICAADYNPTDTTTRVVRRNLSQATVPGKHLVKVQVDQQLYDRIGK